MYEVAGRHVLLARPRRCCACPAQFRLRRRFPHSPTRGSFASSCSCLLPGNAAGCSTAIRPRVQNEIPWLSSAYYNSLETTNKKICDGFSLYSRAHACTQLRGARQPSNGSLIIVFHATRFLTSTVCRHLRSNGRAHG